MRTDPLCVDCPVCKVPTGVECITANNWGSHLPRYQAVDELLACRLADSVRAVVSTGPRQLECMAYLIDCTAYPDSVRARALTLVAADLETGGAS